MSGFLVELEGEADLLGRVGSALQAVQHPQVLMDAIASRLKANVELRFETKTDPNGLAWLPLAESTRARYEKQDKGKRKGSLLQRTGLMLGSLTSNATDAAAEVGFSRPYAWWHEIGTQRMPRRSMLTDDPIAGRLGAQDRQDVLDELEDFLGTALGAR